jgi:non-ribosomal peptide synthase protein (TIGR01720 family)
VILDVTESQDISYTIKHIKEDLRRIPLHGVGYGILKYLTATENKQDLTFRLNPGISFNYLGQFDQNIQTQLFAPSKFPVGLTVSPQLNQFKLPLDINGIVINNELMFSFDFNTNEYQESTIAALMKNFEAALMSINEHCLGIEVSEETPADFENEYLSIEELDSILMSVNKL